MTPLIAQVDIEFRAIFNFCGLNAQLDIDFPAISEARAFQCLCGHLISRYFLSISNYGFLMLKRTSNFPLWSTVTGSMLTMNRNVCIINLYIICCYFIADNRTMFLLGILWTSQDQLFVGFLIAARYDRVLQNAYSLRSH
mgnify:CR=1 FL=1